MVSAAREIALSAAWISGGN